MKKILTHLTGIAFIIAILVAGSCKPPVEQSGTAIGVNDDSTTVRVYLKDTLWTDGRVHLEMYDSKKPDKKVIDELYTDVYPGDTVIFMKAHKSNVKDVINIRQVKEDVEFFSEGDRQDSGLYVLVINPSAPDTTVKYEIFFTVKKDTTTWYIDPYLRIDD